MITNYFLNFVGFILKMFSMILPNWSVWPDVVQTSFAYLVSTVSNFNIILPIDTFFTCLIFIINFTCYLVITKIIIIIFTRKA